MYMLASFYRHVMQVKVVKVVDSIVYTLVTVYLYVMLTIYSNLYLYVFAVKVVFYFSKFVDMPGRFAYLVIKWISLTFEHKLQHTYLVFENIISQRII